MDDLFGEVDTIIGGPGNDVGNFLGSLADQVVARSKRDLLDDVSQAKSERAELLTVPLLDIDVEPLISLDNDEGIKENIPLQLDGKVSSHTLSCYTYSTRLTRFIPGEEISNRRENEEASDCADAEDTPGKF